MPIWAPTDAELEKAREDYKAAEARSKTLQEQLQSAAAELESFRAQQEQSSVLRNQLEKKLADAELAMTRASDDIQSIRQGRADDAAALAAQARQIRELSAKLSQQTETLDRETTLLAASRDIHDLMGARNLHIVDVLDVDSKGNDKRSFGRVFYTEEKSLIFLPLI
jgi:chromosome segregation ATPase